jgi:hypothetical protein
LHLSISSEIARAVLDTGGSSKTRSARHGSSTRRATARGPKFGGTETCVIDCEDNYRGDRPPMGYEVFRRVWYGRPGAMGRRA